MVATPHDIQFSLAEFDRSQLPESQRGLGGDDYRRAVREHLAAQFAGQGGAAEIVVTGDRVIIRWKESSEPESLAEQGGNLLKQGEHDNGTALLRLALERDPYDAAALFNLGMGLGNQGQTAEAIDLLQRLVTVRPDYPGAWVALGVALGRAGQWDYAIRAFREAVPATRKMRWPGRTSARRCHKSGTSTKLAATSRRRSSCFRPTHRSGSTSE